MKRLAKSFVQASVFMYVYLIHMKKKTHGMGHVYECTVLHYMYLFQSFSIIFIAAYMQQATVKFCILHNTPCIVAV